jgi:hypothetical protein
LAQTTSLAANAGMGQVVPAIKLASFCQKPASWASMADLVTCQPLPAGPRDGEDVRRRQNNDRPPAVNKEAREPKTANIRYPSVAALVEVSNEAQLFAAVCDEANSRKAHQHHGPRRGFGHRGHRRDADIIEA